MKMRTLGFGLLAVMSGALLLLSGWLYALEAEPRYLLQGGLGLLLLVGSILNMRRDLRVTANPNFPTEHCCRCFAEHPQRRYTLRNLYRIYSKEERPVRLNMPMCNTCYSRVILSDLMKLGLALGAMALVTFFGITLIEDDVSVIAVVFYLIGVLPVAYLIPIWLVDGVLRVIFVEVEVRDERMRLRFHNQSYQDQYYQAIRE